MSAKQPNTKNNFDNNYLRLQDNKNAKAYNRQKR